MTGASLESGRLAWRRQLRATMLALAVCGTGALAAPSEDPQVSVRQDAGVYRVHATFAVPQPPSVAMAVLTDYEGIPGFVPGMLSSRVLERTADRVIVEQEAEARFLAFSRRLHLLLHVREGQGSVRFAEQSRRSFEEYSGQWRVTAAHGGAAVAYELTARPSFAVPGPLLGRILKRDAQRLVAHLREEMMRRGARAEAVRR